MTDTNTLAPTDAEILALNAGEVHFSESPSKYPAAGFGTQYHAGAPGVLSFARAVLAKWGATAPASQPFAYEFSRSNGDGTHSEHIERGRLQEVAPGRWEHSGLPRGALADKPIKALYTTPQTQPAAAPAGMEPEAAPAQPVAHVSQETFNDDGTSDIIIPALPIGMALYAALAAPARAVPAPVKRTVCVNLYIGGKAYPLEIEEGAGTVKWFEGNHEQGRNMDCAETYEQVRAKRLEPTQPVAEPAPAQALDAQRLTKASRYISTVLRVEGMDLEIGSRRLLREARDAIDAAIAAQQGGQ